MFNDDEEIESLLKRYRPVGPPPDLKKRIFQPAQPQFSLFSQKATPENCHIPAPTVREGVENSENCLIPAPTVREGVKNPENYLIQAPTVREEVKTPENCLIPAPTVREGVENPENCLIQAPTVREGVRTPVLGSKNLIINGLQKYKWAVAAAVIVIAFGTVALWLSHPTIEDRLPDETAQDRVFQDIMHAGQAAQLLAAADLLAKQLGGLKYAREQYEYIIQTYAHLEAAVTAQSKLKSLPERSEYHD